MGFAGRRRLMQRPRAASLAARQYSKTTATGPNVHRMRRLVVTLCPVRARRRSGNRAGRPGDRRRGARRRRGLHVAEGHRACRALWPSRGWVRAVRPSMWSAATASSADVSGKPLDGGCGTMSGLMQAIEVFGVYLQVDTQRLFTSVGAGSEKIRADCRSNGGLVPRLSLTIPPREGEGPRKKRGRRVRTSRCCLFVIVVCRTKCRLRKETTAEQ